MKPMPTVLEVMTPFPQTIASDDSLPHAQAIMDSLQIRHLPVVDNGRLVGLLSDRDIKSAKNQDQLTVGDICELEVYSVNYNEKVSTVASLMAEKKYGSAVVLKNNKVVGIFTTIDACKLLAEVLHHHFPDA